MKQEVEYLWSLLTSDSVKPQPKKEEDMDRNMQTSPLQIQNNWNSFLE